MMGIGADIVGLGGLAGGGVFGCRPRSATTRLVSFRKDIVHMFQDVEGLDRGTRPNQRNDLLPSDRGREGAN